MMTRTYHVVPDDFEFTERIRITATLRITASLMALEMIAGWVRSIAGMAPLSVDVGRVGALVSGVSWAVFAGIVFALWRPNQGWVRYRLEVTDTEVQAIRDDWSWVRHTARRGRVRYLREVNGMLLVSEYGALGTLIFGAVRIPTFLSEYEEIRAEIQKWQAG